MQGATAQTVTVDVGNPFPDNVATFHSLQEAVRSFRSGGTGGVGVNHGNASADVVLISATGGVVDEWLVADAQVVGVGTDFVVLDEPMTIQGSGGSAIIALQQNPAAFFSTFATCGFCWRQDVNLTLKDLAFIPSATNTPTDDAMYFRATTNAASTTITISCARNTRIGAVAPVEECCMI